MALLSAAELRDGLAELAQLLAARGVHADIRVVGGAALALSYYERAVTQDVDTFVYPIPHAEAHVLAAAADVAAPRGWPANWLNTEVRVFAPPGGTPEWMPLLSVDKVNITLAPADLMLAMKLNASRGRRDAQDIDVLLARCAVQSINDAEVIFERFYPGDALKRTAEAAIAHYLARRPSEPPTPA